MNTQLLQSWLPMQPSISGMGSLSLCEFRPERRDYHGSESPFVNIGAGSGD